VVPLKRRQVFDIDVDETSWVTGAFCGVRRADRSCRLRQR
jgi:hypothetical protein